MPQQQQHNQSSLHSKANWKEEKDEKEITF